MASGVEGTTRTITLSNTTLTRAGITAPITSLAPGEWIRAHILPYPEESGLTSDIHDLLHVSGGNWAVEITLPAAGRYSLVWDLNVSGALEEWREGLLVSESALP